MVALFRIEESAEEFQEVPELFAVDAQTVELCGHGRLGESVSVFEQSLVGLEDSGRCDRGDLSGCFFGEGFRGRVEKRLPLTQQGRKPGQLEVCDNLRTGFVTVAANEQIQRFESVGVGSVCQSLVFINGVEPDIEVSAGAGDVTDSPESLLERPDRCLLEDAGNLAQAGPGSAGGHAEVVNVIGVGADKYLLRRDFDLRQEIPEDRANYMIDRVFGVDVHSGQNSTWVNPGESVAINPSPSPFPFPDSESVNSGLVPMV